MPSGFDHDGGASQVAMAKHRYACNTQKSLTSFARSVDVAGTILHEEPGVKQTARPRSASMAGRSSTGGLTANATRRQRPQSAPGPRRAPAFDIQTGRPLQVDPRDRQFNRTGACFTMRIQEGVDDRMVMQPGAGETPSAGRAGPGYGDPYSLWPIPRGTPGSTGFKFNFWQEVGGRDPPRARRVHSTGDLSRPMQGPPRRDPSPGPWGLDGQRRLGKRRSRSATRSSSRPGSGYTNYSCESKAGAAGGA